MTIKDLGIYTRPVLFDTKSCDYPYGLLGSCFGIEYENEYLIITAQHVLDNFENKNILVPYILGSDTFLPINIIHELSYSSEIDDTDKFDLAIIHIEKKKLNKDFIKTSFYKIDNSLLEATSYTEFIIYGFPSKINGIDYEEKKVNAQRMIIEAINITKSPYTYCYSLETAEDTKEYLNGLSGSPVFGLKKVNSQINYCFVGMMIREKYFISARWIYHVIKTSNKSLEEERVTPASI
ncbi:hypothetical protein [Poseidonibacter ostreae]|jgi:hypothetical protein|uniref:Trypsin-like serine protease n=1 Tax=Poseidonibacter ostreae TaxID=2654171 RepID=A0A6L4WRE5_9BACT|nr:hypothetical protein [Poseidonibacter ostreae]KAB7887778.1 hypothetical protein GBG19_10260 [Poseidonibacter ostreae]KAB7888237.1 hypothetical protein GA417_00175 [Poseidonibacter ostreae]KAB7890959.1 hypothetical protein GBG18_07795 [Poseidonibacter ostreae]